MATVDELTRLDREMVAAERQVLRALAEHLRQAVLELPSESRLARSFVRHAAKFDMAASGSGADLWGTLELEKMVREEGRAGAADLLWAAAEMLDPDDPLGEPMRKIARLTEEGA
jgi:hypothetical protein